MSTRIAVSDETHALLRGLVGARILGASVPKQDLPLHAQRPDVTWLSLHLAGEGTVTLSARSEPMRFSDGVERETFTVDLNTGEVRVPRWPGGPIQETVPIDPTSIGLSGSRIVEVSIKKNLDSIESPGLPRPDEFLVDSAVCFRFEDEAVFIADAWGQHHALLELRSGVRAISERGSFWIPLDSP